MMTSSINCSVSTQIALRNGFVFSFREKDVGPEYTLPVLYCPTTEWVQQRKDEIEAAIGSRLLPPLLNLIASYWNPHITVTDRTKAPSLDPVLSFFQEIYCQNKEMEIPTTNRMLVIPFRSIWPYTFPIDSYLTTNETASWMRSHEINTICVHLIFCTYRIYRAEEYSFRIRKLNYQVTHFRDQIPTILLPLFLNEFPSALGPTSIDSCYHVLHDCIIVPGICSWEEGTQERHFFPQKAERLRLLITQADHPCVGVVKKKIEANRERFWAQMVESCKWFNISLSEEETPISQTLLTSKPKSLYEHHCTVM
jgi:hypothetical protein